MISTKIKDSDIAALKVASLPSRPTAPKSFGGAGYTATEMKQAFDRLPLYIVAKFNELIDDLGRSGDNGVCAAIPSGIAEKHTLADMLADIKSGAFASYLQTLGMPLDEVISELRESLRILAESNESSILGAEALTSRTEAIEAAVESLVLSNNELGAVLARQGDAQSALEAQHAIDKTAHAERISALETESSASKKTLATLVAANLISRLGLLETSSDNESRRLTTLETSSNSMDQRLDALEAGTGNAGERLEALEASSGDAAARIGVLEESSDGFETRIGTLEESSGDAATRIGALEESSNGFETRIDTLEESSGDAATRIGALELMRAEDRAILDSIAQNGGQTTDMIIDCGGPSDLV